MSVETPLADFFARYTEFRYNPAHSAHNQFRRLCNFYEWRADDADRLSAQRMFKRALVQEFNVNYGTSEHNLDHWQALCARLDTSPLPTTLGDCREFFMRTHVNIVDLVDAIGTDRKVRVFATVKELSQYAKRTKKYFPRGEIGAGSILKLLLREIKSSSSGGGGSGGRGRGSGRRRRRRAARAQQQTVQDS